MNCRICDKTNVEMFLDLGDQPHCDNFLLPRDVGHEKKYPLQVCFCHNCTTVQINHTVPKEEMFENFLYLSGTTKTLRENFQRTSDYLVERLELRPGDLVVDLGSNDGTWLSCYKKYGLRTLGVDPAKNIAKMANDAGIETLPEYFNEKVAKDIANEKGYAKLITASGVFFHLEDLHNFTEGVKILLDRDGIFCIQAIYLGSILENMQFDQIYHEHLTYWTVRSVSHLLKMHGLEIFSIRHLQIHGGSLEILVKHKELDIFKDGGESGWLKEEANLGYSTINRYKKFAVKVWNIAEQLTSIIDERKKEGKIIHAFSAPAKGSTLLNSFKITNQQIDLAVETNPLKIGRFIPGAHIPIIHENVAEKPDSYLLLAWNFKEEILHKNRDFITNGGEFIIPVPEPITIKGPTGLGC